jgi:DNA-directed RNA polymerase specialized sigma24 family protein
MTTSGQDPDAGTNLDHRSGAFGFQTTHWSAVLKAGEPAAPEAVDALQHLCKTYWYPLYAYCRRQGYPPPDGEDLTQQFFASFLQRNSFASAAPERGRFRNFLLASFKNFLANEHHRRMTVKRGGRMAFLSLDDTDFEGYYRNELADHATPERHFDHAWAMTLLGKVLSGLKTEYEAAGKIGLFNALHIFLTGEKSEAGYQQIATDLAMSEPAVRMAVMRLRQRYGQMLRREIAHTLTDLTGIEDELRHLLDALGTRP